MDFDHGALARAEQPGAGTGLRHILDRHLEEEKRQLAVGIHFSVHQVDQDSERPGIGRGRNPDLLAAQRRQLVSEQRLQAL
jgi:hypothetical protein